MTSKKPKSARPLRVFLSSTFEDLVDYRTRVARAIERLRQQPGRMETFVAEPDTPLEVCRKQVAEADALVVCMAHRYGWVPGVEEGGDGEKSITWYEVEVALEAKKPVFAFLVDPEYGWAGVKEQDRLIDAESDEEEREVLVAIRGLKKFKKFLERRFTRASFTTPEDLAEKVSSSLARWLIERRSDGSAAQDDGVEPEKPDDAEPEIAAYEKWALERHEGLHLIGVGGGEVKVRLDQVYVPLRISHRVELELDPSSGKRRGELARERAMRDVELEEIFRAEDGGGPHAVIFGEPGAGKTTALRKLLHHCLTEGPASLGLDAGTVPVFFPLRRLARADLQEPLPVFLQRELPEHLPDGLAARLWERGRLLLLLDGLDEIADEERRREVCSYLAWQLSGAERRQVRAVVSCRYSGYGGRTKLGKEFLHLDVRPLDAGQVRELVRLWFREVQPLLPDYAETDARRQADGLIAALEGRDYSSQQLKVLVSSPLLLTLLCVVVFRGGEMPRHRVAFYDQCLRVLLGKWGKTTKGEDPLLDADAALAVLRPLAWELHATQRRDDLSKAELVNHLRKRLKSLGHEASPFRVHDWLHRATGVLAEYGPRRYGFMHLGLQEYLAAAHVASRGEELLDELSASFGERWWREVILLLVGLPGHRVFRPLMERVVGGDALLEHADLLRECLAEAPEVDLAPFLGVLERGGDPARQAAVLRLLRGRCDPRLVEEAERLVASADLDLSALARQTAEDCAEPAAETRGDGCDLVLLHLPAAEGAAAELATALERWGMRLFETVDWESELEDLVAGVRGAAVLVTADGGPWERPDLRACLEILDGEDLPLVPVLLSGPEEKPELPSAMRWAPWVDLRGGVSAAAFAALERAARTAESMVVERGARTVGAERAAVSLEVFAAPVAGEPFEDPLTGIQFLWIPGGRFQMGGTAYSDEQPIHSVRLSPFWLGETQVTNRQYGVFLEKTGHKEPELWRDRRFSDPEQPVVGVSWHDAHAFCAWLSANLPVAVTLPSEAQWEYAARGTDGREYPWGNEKPDPGRACFNLDWNEGQPTRVGSFPAGKGPFGTLDQAGNVLEWCRDAWDEDAYKKRAKEEAVDPLVTEGDESVRVLRGGAWSNPADVLRAAYRYWVHAADRSGVVGFRVLAAPASR